MKKKNIDCCNNNFKSVLKNFVSHFDQIVNGLAEKLRTKADGKTVVKLTDEVNRVTLDAIASVRRFQIP